MKLQSRKWYRVVLFANLRNQGCFIADQDNLESGFRDRLVFGEGRIQDWPSGISFRPATSETDGEPEDLIGNRWALPILSSRVVAAITQLEVSDIQFLPVEVRRCDGRDVAGCAIANFVRVVDALDRERSVYERFGQDYIDTGQRGKICSVLKPVLSGPALKGIDAFHLKDWEVAVYVSEKIRNVFVQNQFSGLGFAEVQVIY